MVVAPLAAIALSGPTALLDMLSTTQLSVFIRESAWAFPTIESTHVVALALVIGTIAIIDLRLVGWASRHRRYIEISGEVLPWTWAAFAVAALSGFLMFTSQPVAYWANLAFRLKIALLLIAGANVLIFHLLTCRSVARWNHAPSVPLPARLAGMLSLLLWIAVVFLGRWIGFTMTPV